MSKFKQESEQQQTEEQQQNVSVPECIQPSRPGDDRKDDRKDDRCAELPGGNTGHNY